MALLSWISMTRKTEGDRYSVGETVCMFLVRTMLIYVLFFFQSLSGSIIANSTASTTSSKRCVHILVRSSLLNIIYRRLHLDEKYFITKYLDDTPFIAFNKTPRNPNDELIVTYFTWLSGIMDSFKKNYVSTVKPMKLKLFKK